MARPPILTIPLGARVSVLHHGDGVVRERSADPERGIRYRVVLDDERTAWVSGADVFPFPLSGASPLHAADRLRERYGQAGTRQQIATIKDAILSGRSVLFRNEANGIQRHAVQVDGVAVMVVWDSALGTVVSALPPDAATSRGQKKYR